LSSATFQKIAKGLGISDDAAAKIGKFSGKAIEGAATGAFTNSLLKPLGEALGFKTSATGAKVGGAIGSFLPIPGGDIIGSVLGSLVGGAFKKTPYGKATLTSADGDYNVSGNSSAAEDAAGSFAGAIQAGLQSIAERLGGDLGAFNMTVGTRHGDYRVNTGGDSLKKKGGAVDFDDDAEAATAYGIQQAILQGAITGLSAAVQQAIRSSDDIDKSLQEGLGVQALEVALDGIGGELSATFKAAEREAQERLRLARTYGLDVVKTEELNAKKRADLIDQIISSRIGALQDLADELTTGDLAGGTPADQRQAIAEAAAKAFEDAQAGKEGAADRYADLARQLLGKDADVYGTAGPVLANDRATVQANLDSLIKLETDRVKSAEADNGKLASVAEKTATLTSENNDQNAIIIARLDQLVALSGAVVPAAAGGAADTSRVATIR
jgi:hypothetical protein